MRSGKYPNDNVFSDYWKKHVGKNESSSPRTVRVKLYPEPVIIFGFEFD